MDIGVGSILLSNAMFSKQSKVNSKQKVGIEQAVRETVLSVSPLLILGIARIVSVKSTDYQVHTSSLT